MSNIILQATRVSKQYPTNDLTQQNHLKAIADISFIVEAGEFLCIVGPSGCGKSTLLRMLAGLILPDQGQVYLHGKQLDSPSRSVGLVFQKANLMPWRTVFDNVALPLQVQNIDTNEAAQRVTEALEMVGLKEFVDSYPHQLSGGMAQRVAIARALAHEPEILLLDEPFGALDALTRERLNQELLRLWQVRQETVVMVTHDIREAVFLADRVIVLTQRPGRVAAVIPVDLPRPRDSELLYNSEAFNTLALRVREAIQ